MTIATAALFILLGYLIYYRKMFFLIAGYNTMSDKEKAKYKIEKIALVFRNVMFGMAILILLTYPISIYLDVQELQFYSLGIALTLGIPYLLFKTNSKEYKN